MAPSSGTVSSRAARTFRSTSPFASSASQNSRSFARPAIAFEIQRSCTSRHHATTPLVAGDSYRTRRSRQPAGRTAVDSPTPWASCGRDEVDGALSDGGVRAAGLGLELGARRSFGVRWPMLKSALVDGVPAFLQIVVVAFMVYVATWTGWLLHAHDYERDLSSTQYSSYGGGKDWPTASQPDAEGLGEVKQSLDSLLHYHRDVYMFHTHFLNDSDHTYKSKPSGWLLLNRPVGVDADVDIKPGTQGCDAPAGSDCLRQVLLLGTPALWWGGLPGPGLRGGDVDRRAGLAVRPDRGRNRVDLVAVADVRRPTDLHLLRRRHAAVPRAGADADHGQADRARRADPTAYRRGGGGRVVLRPRALELRVVLADLHRRAAHALLEWTDRIWSSRWI